mgnify:CR=1 FL=1
MECFTHTELAILLLGVGGFCFGVGVLIGVTLR